MVYSFSGVFTPQGLAFGEICAAGLKKQPGHVCCQFFFHLPPPCLSLSAAHPLSVAPHQGSASSPQASSLKTSIALFTLTVPSVSSSFMAIGHREPRVDTLCVEDIPGSGLVPCALVGPPGPVFALPSIPKGLARCRDCHMGCPLRICRLCMRLWLGVRHRSRHSAGRTVCLARSCVPRARRQ